MKDKQQEKQKKQTQNEEGETEETETPTTYSNTNNNYEKDGEKIAYLAKYGKKNYEPPTPPAKPNIGLKYNTTEKFDRTVKYDTAKPETTVNYDAPLKSKAAEQYDRPVPAITTEKDNVPPKPDMSGKGAKPAKDEEADNRETLPTMTDEIDVMLPTKTTTHDQTAPRTESKTSVPESDDEETDKKQTTMERYGFILGKLIGNGNYARVKMAWSKDRKSQVAVKIISKRRAPAEYTQKFLPREVEAVKGLHHPNIIKFYQSVETTRRVYIVMQYAEKGTLLDYVRAKRKLNELEAHKYYVQLIDALIYIHSKGVVHRDIKCENLLLDAKSNLKLIDFGFARKYDEKENPKDTLSKTFCGSYAYASPEILNGVPYNPFQSDIWACGIVLYAMTCGRLPYDGSNVAILLKKIAQPLTFSKVADISEDCKNHTIMLLSPVEMRASLADIINHPWFTKK